MLDSVTSMETRDARPSDARALAELIAIAGAGIPEWLWAGMAGPGETPLDVGIRRAMRDHGGFSWRNAIVAEMNGQVSGMILGYKLETDEGEPAAIDPVLLPFLELERLVPESWYINAFAVYEPWRCRGVGGRLLTAAAERAKAAGCAEMSVQTFSQTPRSEAFYARYGFVRIESRPLPEPSVCAYGGDTVLLTRTLDNGTNAQKANHPVNVVVTETEQSRVMPNSDSGE
ncbi:MAG: GNAT family N-acetyltransferase [Alphaproteobacteria bacterium]